MAVMRTFFIRFFLLFRFCSSPGTLSSIGYPILGDVKYADVHSAEFGRRLKVKYQLLHSYELVMPELSGRFENISGMKICSEYPKNFKRFFDVRK